MPRQEPRRRLRRRRRGKAPGRPQGDRHRPRLQRGGQAEVGVGGRRTRVAETGVDVLVVIGGSGPVPGAGIRPVLGKCNDTLLTCYIMPGYASLPVVD